MMTATWKLSKYRNLANQSIGAAWFSGTLDSPAIVLNQAAWTRRFEPFYGQKVQ